MKAFSLFLLAGALFAQSQPQPSVSHANFETKAFAGDLNAAAGATLKGWFGYAFETDRGDHRSCCYADGRRSGCSLEGDNAQVFGKVSQTGPVSLEGSNQEQVLFRVENGQVQKVRVFSLDCGLDAGGLRFVWLRDVPAAASLAYLAQLASRNGREQVMDGALLAISLHEAARADEILEGFTRPSESAKLREKTVFWIGVNRGERGVRILKDVVTHDPNEQVRDKAVFALSISKQPAALDALLETAKRDPAAHVRSQALFWLAQKAGKRSADTIQNAIENDPDGEVRKKAVFAMSQLPKDESVPRLIEIARTQRNPAVRKQAFFWLGQSNDPRALAFFEQVLK